jgi:RHS repeat-associated protein
METFGYDSLDRLTSVALNGAPTLSVGYDSIGNISNKSDIGTYNYTQQVGCNYTGLSAQPHAVRQAGGTLYCYDADGNMTSRGAASVSWYPYNQPQMINQAGGNYSTFFYAPDRSRYRQVSLNGSTTEDRTYITGLFEKLNSSLVGIEYRHYIVADGKTVAVRVVSGTRNDTYYLHDDHLGSTGAITDQSGNVQIQESFDAWGKRRGSAWAGSPSSSDWTTINKTTHLGFTAQEELDNLSLVDLNGRVYDPTVARFMSADPYVQAPYQSQSLNRYSYTFDNPLNATDPTGFDTCTGTHIPGAGCPAGSYVVHINSGDAGSSSSQAENQPITHVVSTDGTQSSTGQNDGQTGARQQSAADQQQPTWSITVSGSRSRSTWYPSVLSIADFLSLTMRGYFERPMIQPIWNGMSIVQPGLLESHSILSDPEATQGAEQANDFLGALGQAATMIPAGPEELAAEAATGGFTGTAYEFRHIAKHIEGTAASIRLIAREGAAHVFSDKATLAAVENAIFKGQGIFTGVVRGTQRFGLWFDRPIGARIAADGTRIPLFYGEAKVSANGLYHVIPRTGPSIP